MKALWLLVLLLLIGCVHPVPVPIEPNDTHLCAAACVHLEQLGCEEGQPLPDGTSCAVFCEKTQQAGHALNPTCVLSLKSCEAIDICQVNREGTR